MSPTAISFVNLRFVLKMKLIVERGHHILLDFVRLIEFASPKIVFVSMTNNNVLSLILYSLIRFNFFQRSTKIYFYLKVQQKTTPELIALQFAMFIVPMKKSIVQALPMKRDASSPIAVYPKEKTKMVICVLVCAL